jgi:hypothetical protein
VPTTLTLQYRLQGRAWASSGTLELPPVQFAPGVPVLETDWVLHTPKTFSITDPETTLESLDLNEVPNVVQRGFAALGDVFGGLGGGQSKATPRTESSATGFALHAVTDAPADRDIRREITSAPGAVETGLRMAQSAVELGNYDQAIAQYNDVLRVDPYSAAARRGMESAERKRQQYFTAAYDHQRAKMLSKVDEMWEEKVPTSVTATATVTTPGSSAGAYLMQKMDRIIFPSVQFANATLVEAIEFLRLKSRILDTTESDPSRKGVNIILRSADAPSNATINLDLKNVPLSEALRYVCDLAQMKFKVEAYGVVVAPISDSNTEMYNRTFAVKSGDLRGVDIQKHFMNQGVTFPDGAYAGYDAKTNQIIVRNTQPNLALVQALLDPSAGEKFQNSYKTQRDANLGSLAAAAADPFASPASPAMPPPPPVLGRGEAESGAAEGWATRGALAWADLNDPASALGKSGLLPLTVAMPSEGRVLRFAGLQPPPVLHLHYQAWEHQMRWAVLAMLGGMVAFALLAWRRRPWTLTMLVVILAALAFPLVLQGQMLALANAAAFGWVLMFAVRVVTSLLKRLPQTDATMSGEEVAV